MLFDTDWRETWLMEAAIWKFVTAILLFIQAHFESHNHPNKLRVIVTVFVLFDVVNVYAAVIVMYFISRTLVNSFSVVTSIPEDIIHDQDNYEYLKVASKGLNTSKTLLIVTLVCLLFTLPCVLNIMLLYRLWTNTKCKIMSMPTMFVLAGSIRIVVCLLILCCLYTKEYSFPTDSHFYEARYMHT